MCSLLSITIITTPLSAVKLVLLLSFLSSASVPHHGLARTTKESIYIRVYNPTLNRNVGKYNLHHIWDRVLFNTPDLKINNDNGHAHKTSLSGYAQSIPRNKHSHRIIGHIGHALNSDHVNRMS